MNERKPVLGVDGALDGGAVLLAPSGRRAMGWGWRRRERKAGVVYVLRSAGYGCTPRTVDLPSLHEVARQIADVAAGYQLVVEDLFVPHPSDEDLETKEALTRYLGRVRSTQALAEAVGEIVGPLRGRAEGEVQRVVASTWRKVVLGSGSLSSSVSEERAIELVTRGRPPLIEGLGELAQDPHVAEAACIARWGWLQQLGAAQQALLGRAR